MNASSSLGSAFAKKSSSSTSFYSTLTTRLGCAPLKPVDGNTLFWSCLVLLVAVGSLGLYSQLMSLWGIWTTDPLRSIGMLILPASLVLVLRVWRQNGWELRGSWWGLLLVILAFLSTVFSWEMIISWNSGPLTVGMFSNAIPLYLYASGVILLFAGKHIWRQAWFPLALILFVQPVPGLAVHLFDLPLQSFSAHVARSFATLIGFPPTNPELLKLMFTPDFGMFIAPGCDGMRGAVTLGYVALIVGYLKRVSISRWILYVFGAVLLGHIFNLLRLCALVLYYRLAVGHHALEQIAKQADYAIGICLILVATVLFFWVVLRKEDNENAIGHLSMPLANACAGTEKQGTNFLIIAAFAMLVLFVIVHDVRAIQKNHVGLAAFIHGADRTPQVLDARIPKQLGDYKLNRTWQEQLSGVTVLENAAYRTAKSNEITVGIWLPQYRHSVYDSMMIHGESAEMLARQSFVTARGRPVPFDTAYYSDGVTDSFVGNTYCNPSFCLSSLDNDGGLHFAVKRKGDFSTRGARFIPIFFRVEKPHTDAPKANTYKELSAESQSFISNVDFTELSEKFQ
jgi:exosortase J